MEVLSPDLKGNVKWRKVEALTKHPVVNPDGTNILVKVSTRGGREVIATKSKSFVRFNKDTKELEEANGSDVVVGDLVPIHSRGFELNEEEELRSLNLEQFLPKTEYLYGTDLEKAKSVCEEHLWWKKYHGKLFTLPYSRSDACYSFINHGIRENSKSKQVILPGFVYPKKCTKTISLIPENIILDWSFGYFLGSYCAEGCVTKTQISISNNDLEYLQPIIELCDKWNITYKIYKHTDKNNPGWTSQDIRIYSTLLTELTTKLCGKLSHKKFIHSSLLAGNKEFLSGICSGYFGGDGTIKNDGIQALSVSRELLETIQIILLRIGDIHSTIHTYKKPTENNRGTIEFKQPYVLWVRNQDVIKFAENIKLTIEDKQLKLESISKKSYKYEHNRIANIQKFKDVILDEIVKIEEIPNSRDYVYDLTVEETRLFQTFDGLAIRDTFHLAGVAEKSNVIRGIPRLNEILHLSKNLKGPSVTVFLPKEDRLMRERADILRKKLMRTTMRDLVSEVRVYYDTQIPGELPTTIALESNIVKSQWRMAMDIDPLALHDRGITMETLYIAVMKAISHRLNDVVLETTDTNEPTLKLTFSILSTDDVGNDEASDAIMLFNELETIIMDKVVIQGIRGIEYCTLRKLNHSLVQEDHEFKEIEEFVVDTVGSNLLEILGTPGVDATRSFTNHIVEVNDVLGIHAARNSILREIVDVFEDTYINHRHLLLLADLMTYRGKLMSIDRHGVNRSDAGPLAKASFEETDTMLTKAAVQGELDPVTGVTSNIMFGQPIYGGTGMSQIMLDETLFEKTFKPPRETRVEPEETEIVDAERETYCDTRAIRLTSLPVEESKEYTGGDYDDIGDDF
jgi:DNA-directed RNA polymerase beta' subunit